MFYAIKRFRESISDNPFVWTPFYFHKLTFQIGQLALREIQILNHLKPHANIVELVEFIKEDDQMWLVFEQLNRTILEEIQQTRGLDNLEAKKIIY